MANDLNLCQFIGRLGKDPETKTTQSGNTMTNITLAVGSSWTDKNTGQKQEATEWVRVTYFGKLADIAAQYLTKGSKVYTSGKFKTRKYQDSNGQDKYSTEINGSELQFLDSRQGADNQQARVTPPQATPESFGAGDFEDDLPFMRLDSRVY